MRIVFFGTPPFARTVLEYLLDHGIEVAAVISKPDKPTHRSSKLLPSAVKQCALDHNLPVFTPPKASDPAFIAEHLEPLGADVFVVAAFSEILKENLLAVPKLGCINVHASLLPHYRGAAPIQRCIMAGEKESGVTIMAMDAGLDTGGMLKKVVVPITEDMTAGELSIELAARGSVALFEVLQEYAAGKISLIPQEGEGASYAKKLKSDDGRITWERPSNEIYNHIRGVSPKPGAWCEVSVRGEVKRLRIKKARHCPDVAIQIGLIQKTDKFPLVIGCASGGIALLEVQLEGKKAMDANAFLNGMRDAQLKFSLNT